MKTVWVEVVVSDWYMANAQQVTAAQQLISAGQYPQVRSFGPFAWVVRSASWGRRLPTVRTRMLSVRVPASDTAAQAQAVEQSAAASATGVTAGVFATPTLHKTYHSVSMLPLSAFWFGSVTTKPTLIGSVNR